LVSLFADLASLLVEAPAEAEVPADVSFGDSAEAAPLAETPPLALGAVLPAAPLCDCCLSPPATALSENIAAATATAMGVIFMDFLSWDDLPPE
jgi:hypothetical protein